MEPWEKLELESPEQYEQLIQKTGPLEASPRRTNAEPIVGPGPNRVAPPENFYDVAANLEAQRALEEQAQNEATLQSIEQGDEFINPMGKPLNELTDKEIAALYKGGGLGVDYSAFGPDLSGFGRAKKALQTEAALAQIQGEAEANLALEQQKLLEDNAKQQELRAIAQKKQTDQALSELAQSRAELAEMKIDPNRFWADKSTGDKVVAGISVFLGGFAAGYNGGGQNRALQTIQSAIERDIQMQKNNILKKKDDIGEQESMYQRYLNKFQNEDAAEAATLANSLAAVQNKIKVMASSMKGQQGMVNAEKGIAQLEMAEADAKNKFAVAMAEQAAKKAEAQAKKGDLWVEGWGEVRNDKLYKDFATKAAKYGQGQDLIDSLVRDIENYTASESVRVKSQLEADIATKTMMLQSAYRDTIVGPGTLTEFDFNRLKEGVPSGARAMPWLRQNAINRLRAIQTEAEREMDAMARVSIRGYKPTSERRKSWNRID